MAAKTQHTRPCTDCPFSKNCKPSALGGSAPETYIGQANGPFFLPCHATHNYKDEKERMNHANPQCAGAAIFRANVGVAGKMPKGLLQLPPGEPSVFGSFAAFLAHHRKVTVNVAALFLSRFTPDWLMRKEMEQTKMKQVAIRPPLPLETPDKKE